MAYRFAAYGKMYGIDWENVGFLTLTHVLGVAGILWLALVHFSFLTLLLGVGLYALSFLAIAAGYHRFYAHRTHSASRPLELFYLVMGAAGFQATVLDWASWHTDHHGYTDQAGDPHDIGKGFLWAHIGWLIYNRPPRDHRNVRALESNRLVRWQARWYLPLAIGFGLVLPTALGALWGDAVGGLLVAGFLRLMLQYHFTFCVNSVAHIFGDQVIKTESARNGRGVLAWLLALFTFGETGGHGSHHGDTHRYRFGRRWFDPDLAAWFIWLSSRLRLATIR